MTRPERGGDNHEEDTEHEPSELSIKLSKRQLEVLFGSVAADIDYCNKMLDTLRDPVSSPLMTTDLPRSMTTFSPHLRSTGLRDAVATMRSPLEPKF